MRFLDKPGRDPAPLLIALAAAGIRLAYLVRLASSPFFRHPILDAHYYREWAGRLAGSGFHFFAEYQGNPLYPYFLAFLLRFFRAGPILIRVVQHGLGVATCLLLLRAGTILGGRRTGILAALLYAFYIPAVFYEGWLLPAALTAFLSAAFLTSLLNASRSDRLTAWIGGGAVGGLLTLARPSLIPLAGLAWILTGLRGAKVKTTRPALGVLGGLLLVLLPASLYLSRAWGDPVLVSPHGGINFYIGNNPGATGYSRIPPFARGTPKLQHEDFRREARRRTGRELTPAESSGFWFREGLSFVASRPGRFIRLTGLKIYYFFSSTSFSDNYHLLFFRQFFSFLRFSLAWRLLAVLGAVGMITGWKRRKQLSLLYLLTAGYLLSIALFFVTDRFRLPAAPLLAVFAAGAVLDLGRAIGRRKAKRTVLLVFAGALLWFGLGRLPEAPSPAASYLAAGEVYSRDGRHLEAAGFLEEARAASPELPQPGDDTAYRIDLARGEAYLGAGETEKAGEILAALKEHYRGELREPNFDIANTYAAHHHYREARRYFRSALAEDPEDYRAWNNLGLAYTREGMEEEGAEAYARALRVKPDHAPALVNLGNLLAARGEYEAALARFREALEIDPGLFELHRAAAFCLERLNRFSEAAQELRKYHRAGGGRTGP